MSGILLLRVSILVIKHHDQEQVGKERVYFIFLVVYYQGKVRPETQRWNLEAGTEIKVREECCLLACSSSLALVCFLLIYLLIFTCTGILSAGMSVQRCQIPWTGELQIVLSCHVRACKTTSKTGSQVLLSTESSLQTPLCFLIHLRTTCSEMTPSISDCALPKQSFIKKTPLQTCLWNNLMETFSQLKIPLIRWHRLVSSWQKNEPEQGPNTFYEVKIPWNQKLDKGTSTIKTIQQFS